MAHKVGSHDLCASDGFSPAVEFRRCVERYRGDYNIQSFSFSDQFLCFGFAQLTGCESLRDIEACLRLQQANLYDMRFHGRISRNALLHANETCDWRIFAEFARILIGTARELHRHEPFRRVELAQTVYALDSTTIDLCLSMFPCAQFPLIVSLPHSCRSIRRIQSQLQGIQT